MSGTAPATRGLPSRSVGPSSASASPASIAGEPVSRWKSSAPAKSGSADWLPVPWVIVPLPAVVRKFEWSMVIAPLGGGGEHGGEKQ
jgi:hypothetical protein